VGLAQRNPTFALARQEGQLTPAANLNTDPGPRQGKEHRIGIVNHRPRHVMPRTVAPSPFPRQCQKADG
ncbi:MAG: hypothetical protein MUP33_01820, partial [Polaromonas sp.]|nr:hypothetical protein [Polaromonas sp.]